MRVKCSAGRRAADDSGVLPAQSKRRSQTTQPPLLGFPRPETILKSLFSASFFFLLFFSPHPPALKQSTTKNIKNKSQKINHIDKPDKLHLAGRVNRELGHAERSEAQRPKGERESLCERERERRGRERESEGGRRAAGLRATLLWSLQPSSGCRQIAALTRYKNHPINHALLHQSQAAPST